MAGLYGLELSRFGGRVNTEVYGLSAPVGSRKLHPQGGGVKGSLAWVQAA